MQNEHSSEGVVIAVGNQKGGVGKTTNTVHLAAALGLFGFRSLIIDLDPSAGATKHLGVLENAYAGTLELLTDEDQLAPLAITEDLPIGVHLIPARPQLSELDAQLSRFVDRSRILQRPLAEARAEYDYIFLDTSPHPADITTLAAYANADWFLLSALPHYLSLAGLNEAFRDIVDARTHRNPALEILGIVFCCVDERAMRMRRHLENALRSTLPGRCFDTSISQAVALPECSGMGRTLFQVPRFRNHKVAVQYLRLALEIEHRVSHRKLFLAGTLRYPDFDDQALLRVADRQRSMVQLHVVDGRAAPN